MSGFAPPKPAQPDNQAHRHQLERDGYNALLSDHCELVEDVADLHKQIAALEQRIAILELAWVVGATEALDAQLAALASGTDIAHCGIVWVPAKRSGIRG